MKSRILTMVTETNIHVGGGRSTSAVDLPFYREKITEYPSIPSSSLKGALRAAGRGSLSDDKLKWIFGKPDHVGSLKISDARLLLLPVRSLTSNYKWITCKYILERFIRDIGRTNSKSLRNDLVVSSDKFKEIEVEKGTAWSNNPEDNFFLEEFELEKSREIDSEILDMFKNCMPFPPLKSRLDEQLVLLHADDFKWFANYGLPIITRNVLKKETKKSKHIWYEELVANDTVFYTVLLSENPDVYDEFSDILNNNYLQIGGNESIGQGWVRTKEFGD